MADIQMLPAETFSFLRLIYYWGIDVIKAIQVIENPGLTAVVKACTAMGTEFFYFPLILFIFWIVDERRAFGFSILMIISAWINGFMKELLKQPRPFNLEPSLGLIHESSYGAPSGHAQMSLIFMICVAVWLTDGRAFKSSNRKRALVRAAAVTLILLIGFSRLYLGVHFPTDLLAGWIIGALILVVWFKAGPRLEILFARAGIRSQNICAAVIALVMNGLRPGDRALPGLFLGLCAGYTLMKKNFPFRAQEEMRPGLKIIIARFLAGLLGAAIVYQVSLLIFPGGKSLFRAVPFWGGNSPFYDLGLFIRYGLLGLWVSAGAPLIFQRAGLAPAPNDKNAGNQKDSGDG
jgi:membrane-associated phospholipid phosphatase